MSVDIFTPLHNYILVDKLEQETMRGAIYLPDTAGKESPLQGTVLSIGPGKTENGVLVPMTVKVGQRVSFPEQETRKIIVNGASFCF